LTTHRSISTIPLDEKGRLFFLYLTTFAVYLPVSGQEATKPLPEERPRAGSGRILVMDDEDAIRGLLVQILTLSGYVTEIARDGTEAIAMDLTIPGGMDRKETMKYLLDIDPHVKAIVSSGYANGPVMADYRQYGFMGVVVKPFKMVELTEVLHQVLTTPSR
jgi:two-component system, cell cycle sensor histidine kinase and response regulator CckA